MSGRLQEFRPSMLNLTYPCAVECEEAVEPRDSWLVAGMPMLPPSIGFAVRYHVGMP